MPNKHEVLTTGVNDRGPDGVRDLGHVALDRLQGHALDGVAMVAGEDVVDVRHIHVVVLRVVNLRQPR